MLTVKRHPIHLVLCAMNVPKVMSLRMECAYLALIDVMIVHLQT